MIDEGMPLGEELFFRDMEYALKYRVPRDFKIDGLRLVWYCKTIQNRKALVITTPYDGKFYEVTYDGDDGKMYVDQYEKRAKQTFTRDELDAHRQETDAFREAMDERTRDPFMQDITSAIKMMREVVAKKRKELEEERKE